MLRDTAAELCVGASPGELRVQLSRMEPRQAAEELKELLFTMADRLCESAAPASLITCVWSHFCPPEGPFSPFFVFLCHLLKVLLSLGVL